MLPTALALVCRSVRFITTFDIKKYKDVSTQQKSMDKTFYYWTYFCSIIEPHYICITKYDGKMANFNILGFFVVSSLLFAQEGIWL